MGANMHANGGKLLKELRTPDFKKYGVEVKKHGKYSCSRYDGIR